GVAVEDVCRKAGISLQTYYRWRKKYGGLMPSEMKRLKLLEEENSRLKKLVADLSLDKTMLQDVVERKLLRPPGPGSWSSIYGPATGSASGVPVAWSASTAPPSTISTAVLSRRASGSVSASCRKPVSDTAIAASTSCCGARAGRSTTSARAV